MLGEKQMKHSENGERLGLSKNWWAGEIGFWLWFFFLILVFNLMTPPPSRLRLP